MKLQPITLCAGIAMLALPAVAGAAKAPVKRIARRPAAAATVEAVPPPTGSLDINGQMTPAEVMLRPTTAPESEANAIWNVRAALNIAALQCQFSPFLATVNLYNAVLKQHGEEFDRARLTLVAHFRRYDRDRGPNSFDQYTTRVYNSFSTLDAQYAFCERSALIGRELLGVPKKGLGPIARDRAAAIRAALVPVSPLLFLGTVDVAPVEPNL